MNTIGFNSLTKIQIESLPLFINISENESLSITNSKTIIPPNDWFFVCENHYSDISVHTKNHENISLLHKSNYSIPSIKYFFANHLCKDLDSLPQDVCVLFLRSIGQLKESESIWFAPHNKENKEIINAISTKKLIVFDDGHRCAITEIMDSSDNILSSLANSQSEKVCFLFSLF